MSAFCAGYGMGAAPWLAAASLAASSTPAIAQPDRTAAYVADLAAGATGGDADGAGRAEISLNQSRLLLCYRLTTGGIAPAKHAELRRGGSDTPGSLVANLVSPKDGSSSACREVSAYVASELASRPEAFFVTIRNDEFPQGALRGRLHR